jgi:AcrR family transcriptional regulator
MTKSERTREMIIQKAAPLFNRKGIAGTSLSDILTVTKLAKGSLYVHFKDKEDLARAVVDHHLDRIAQLTDDAIQSPASARDKLFSYIDTFMHPETPPFAGGCPMLNFGMEADDTDKVIRTRINAAMEQIQQKLITILKKGMATGEFNNKVDYKTFATKMFALVQGGIMMKRVSGNSKAVKVIAKVLKNEIEQMST